MIERWNSEGIPRDQLKIALKTPRIVHMARRVNACLLCRRPRVNLAGLCDVCEVLVQDAEEQRLMQLWLTGEVA